MLPSIHVTSPDAPGVVITAARLRTDSGGNTPPTAGRKFVVTRITVANTGTRECFIAPDPFTLLDSGDLRLYVATDRDRAIIHTGMQPTSLLPGQRDSFDVAFEVPTGDTTFILYWEPRFYASKVPVGFGT